VLFLPEHRTLQRPTPHQLRQIETRHSHRLVVGDRAYSVSVTLRQLVFERDYDLPRAIVWDALVEPVLVGGWLGEARIDAVPGGEYHLDWVGSTDFPATDGRISALSEPERLTVVTNVHGELQFALDELDGGPRGSSTRLRLTVTLELADAFEARVRANWISSLEQLAALLRGHPVEWHGGALTGSRSRADTRPKSPGRRGTDLA